MTSILNIMTWNDIYCINYQIKFFPLTLTHNYLEAEVKTQTIYCIPTLSSASSLKVRKARWS